MQEAGLDPLRSATQTNVETDARQRGLLVLPAAHDALTAKLIERTGFPAYQIGGFALVGARCGRPDIDAEHFGERSEDVQEIMDGCDVKNASVRQELTAGQKRTHWMWFVFPQLSGLGHSATTKYYALRTLEEAALYLRHPILGLRLTDCTELVLKVGRKSAYDIFGSPDDLKFQSSMTLFAAVPDAPVIFVDALAKYFGGAPDPATIKILEGRP